jgi:PKD repeat protein
MRTSHGFALALGLTGLGTACGDGNDPSNISPAAAFTPACVLLDCTFADGSTDADGQVTAYTWDFGDGTAAAVTKDAAHTYGAANTYPVRLTVTDNDGATSDLTQSVLVHAPANMPPTAAFTSSCAGLVCSFTGLGSDGDGTVVGFQWDFGDGAIAAATQDATHNYASAGTYAVELTVTDDGGATGHLSQQVTATGPASGEPTASFAGSCVITGSYTRIVFVDCTFTDQSTAAAGATVTGWAWDFGDGRTSTDQNPPVQHYTISWRPGMRVSARLTVTDNNGLSNGVAMSVPVSTAPTIALAMSSLLQNLCYPARQYSVRGCPSGGSVTISNTGGGALKWTSTTSAPWLKRSPTSGTAPSTMTVWVDGAALSPGSYSGEILISAEGATNSPRGVFVHVTR